MHKRTRAIPPCDASWGHPSPTATPWIAAMLALATGACEPTPRDEQSALARDSAGVTGISQLRTGRAGCGH